MQCRSGLQRRPGLTLTLALTLIRGVRSCADSDGALYSLTCHRPTHLDANRSREEGLSFARGPREPNSLQSWFPVSLSGNTRVRGIETTTTTKYLFGNTSVAEFICYRLGWPRTQPAVGQSFPTERLGISLTRRLPTPPDRPSHHYWPGAPSFFKHPSSPEQI